jgi:hypothetical protein
VGTSSNGITDTSNLQRRSRSSLNALHRHLIGLYVITNRGRLKAVGKSVCTKLGVQWSHLVRVVVTAPRQRLRYSSSCQNESFYGRHFVDFSPQ